jgi:hypothetical protein
MMSPVARITDRVWLIEPLDKGVCVVTHYLELRRTHPLSHYIHHYYERDRLE